jgi:F-type H+-transporting ATPase subunit b
MMNWGRCQVRTGIIVMVALLAAVFGVTEAVAAEGGGGWRPVYDLIMRWVNFAILVFVIVKFARRPLKNFLAGKGEEISAQIRDLDVEKNQLVERVRQTEKDLADSTGRLEEIKERIVQLGERRKQEIIAEAHQESLIIMENAKRKIEGRLNRAQSSLRAEMIDSAAELALERLPGIITAEDNQKLLQRYMAEAAVD